MKSSNKSYSPFRGLGGKKSFRPVRLAGGLAGIKRALLFLSLFPSLSFSQAIFDITKYGAKSDGKTVNTKTIQQAIDDCNKVGGGTVLFPQGTFVTGTLILKSNVTIYLAKNAILKGSGDLADYPDIMHKNPSRIESFIGSTRKAVLYAEFADNIAMTGEGTFYPAGDQEVFQDHLGESPNRPYGLKFVNCNYVTVSNIHMRNSAYWMQRYLFCDHLRLTGLKVWNHCNINNDGMDIDGCHDVVVSDCFIDASDDGICLKSEGLRACEDVVVTNCVVSSFASALKLGTGSLGGFHRIAFSNCVVRAPKAKVMNHGVTTDDTQWGGLAGIDIGEVDGGLTEYVSFNNIVIDSAETPIFIRLGSRNGRASKEDNQVKNSTIRNISLSNISIKNGGPVSCAITGLPGHRIENVRLSNILVHTRGGGTDRDTSAQIPEYERDYPMNRMFGSNLPAYGFYVRHVKDISFSNIEIKSEKPDERSAIVLDDVERAAIIKPRLLNTSKSQPSIKLLRSNNVEIESFAADASNENFMSVGDIDTKDVYLNGTVTKKKPFKTVNSGSAKKLPPADSALIGSWSFDEGKGETVADASLAKNKGKAVNPEWVSGKKGKALKFKKGAYVDCGNPKTLNIAGDISVAFWMKLDNPASMAYYRIISKRKEWDNPTGFELELSPGNNRLNFTGGNKNMVEQGLAKISYDADWHYYVATISDGRMRLYIDSKLVAWDDNVAPASVIDMPFMIGSNSFGKDNLEGVLDEMKLWNRGLSEQEVKAMSK